MDAEERAQVVAQLDRAFGGAIDVTPTASHDLHVLLTDLELVEPWEPSPTRGLVVFTNWPGERPLFYIADDVVGEGGRPPTNPQPTYLLDQTWHGFSWSFAWKGDDPVRAVQLWVNRFVTERN